MRRILLWSLLLLHCSAFAGTLSVANNLTFNQVLFSVYDKQNYTHNIPAPFDKLPRNGAAEYQVKRSEFIGYIQYLVSVVPFAHPDSDAVPACLVMGDEKGFNLILQLSAGISCDTMGGSDNVLIVSKH